MSTTIDNRVVEMQFDNRNFERNVQTSMSTLEKLKQSLNLTGAAKGFENIDSASKKLNFNGLGSAVETIHAKFSALEVMGITALANITNSAVNAGKRIVSALTIDPIKTGFQEYETQINAVQTILANTESKGTTLNDVNGALDELNKYADKTIYNFTEMTRNIGTFTAAGVDLDTSVSSIQGIANLAAVSGSTSQQASTAMYQLSQALAAGKVSLMDWNSVVNAGMGGQVFQDALKRTATVMGKDVDGMIKKYGSFRESLTKGEWLTTDVLTKTLEQFTMAAEEGSKEWENYKKSLMDEGYTEKQANEILKMANTATDAATKVKTFTQLWDTLKEAAQSGWTQTWEILVGDFEEAKSMLTNVSNVINDMIGKSAEARNELLKGWKEAGGRDDLLAGFKNAFEGVMNIAKPIKEAFRDIFPPLTVDQLVKFTKGFKDLTASFKDFTATHGDKIKSTFKGIFSVLDIGWTLLKELGGGIVDLIGHFTGLGGGVLGITSSIGSFLSNIRDSVKEGNLFGRMIDFVVDILGNGIDKVKEFGTSLKESFKTDKYEGFVGFLKGVWEFVSQIGSGLVEAFSGLGKAIANVFGENSFGDVLESGGLAVLGVGLYKLINNLNGPFESLADLFDNLFGAGGMFDEGGIITNIKGIFGDVRECFEAYQQNLQADTLMKIAKAIGLLTAAIFVISTIDAEKLGSSLEAITVLFVELIGALAIFSKFGADIKGTIKAVPLMMGMSTALLILAGALKIISSMNPDELSRSLVGVGVGLGILVGALHLMPEKVVHKAAKSIRSLSISLVILGAALKVMSSMSWDEIGRGLVAMAGAVGIMVTALKLMPRNWSASIEDFGKITANTNLISAGIAMIAFAGAMKILASAMEDFGKLKLTEIGKGLLAIGGSMAIFVVAINKLPKTMFGNIAGHMVGLGVGMIAMAGAMVILTKVLKDIGGMKLPEIIKGLAGIGASMLIMAKGMKAMTGSLSGSAALLVAVTALGLLVPVIKALGNMSIGSIVKSLGTLAGALIIFGIAAKVLGPMSPLLYKVAGAFVLFGISVAAIGAGLTLIGAGIGSISGALAAGATSIVASLTVIITGILDLVPTIVTKFGEAIVAFCKVIGDSAPQIAESLLKLISEVLKSSAKYIPLIADSLFELLIGVLDVLSARMPELVVAAVKVISSFFQGIVDALKNIDTKSMLQGAIAVGLLTGLMYALSGVAALVPSAMTGVLGLGLVIAELALVLAAIGGLAQIPGLEWLISEGGNFLQTIGTAIGQFVGGIVGGVAQGATSTLPEVGTNLANFMTNVKPFIDGAKSIDPAILEGVKALASAVLMLTGADIVSSLASFITGGSSLEDFGVQLVPFGESMKQYGESVAGVDTNAIMASATAAKALVMVAEAIPKSGGLASLFSGENDLTSFAAQLVPFGTALKEYSLAVAGIDSQAIIGSASAAKAIADMANTVPNEGGMIAWFTGENSLAKFSGELVALGMGLKAFAVVTTGIVPESIIGAANAARSLADMMNVIPNEGGLVAWLTGENSVARFGNDLLSLGMGLKAFSVATTGIVPDSIIASANAAKALASMMNTIPNEGGLVAWLTGENSVSTFASQLVNLGYGLQGFSVVTTGIVPENITAAANAAKSLAQMMNVIPNEGGIAAWFTGESSIANFSSQLPKLGKGLSGFSEAVAGINAENITAAANAAKALAQMTNVIPKEGGIKAWFTGETSISSFASKLPTLGDGLKKFSDSVAGINAENITAASKAAKSLAQMADTTPKNTGKIVTFGENLVKFGDKLKSYFANTSGITAEVVTTSTNAIKSIKTATTSLDAASMDNASKAIDSLVKSVKNMSKVAESSVTGFSNAMKKLGETNVKSIAKSFEEAAPKLSKTGQNVIKNITEGIKSQESKIKTAGQTAMKKLIEGIKSQESNAKKACTSVVSSCVTAINSVKSKFRSAGANLVKGFAAGISANTYLATAKAKAMANAAEKAARDALDINSPSRVFKEIGSGVPEGFAMGIGMLGNLVQKSTSTMATRAINSTKNALSRISDVINSDVDAQPVISPVLDLSNIKSGARTISDMLGVNPSIATLSNIRSVSSMMNQKNQNGTNNDIILELSKLRKTIGNVGGNTYQINGITYDDGSTVSEAIGALIRAVNIERRV